MVSTQQLFYVYTVGFFSQSSLKISLTRSYSNVQASTNCLSQHSQASSSKQRDKSYIYKTLPKNLSTLYTVHMYIFEVSREYTLKLKTTTKTHTLKKVFYRILKSISTPIQNNVHSVTLMLSSDHSRNGTQTPSECLTNYTLHFILLKCRDS